MIDGRQMFNWTRDVLAIFGAIGCGLFAVVFLTILLSWPGTRTSAAAKPEKPTLDEAAWLINAAGLDGQRKNLHLVDSGRHVPDTEDGASFVQVWCLGGAQGPQEPKWIAPEALEPAFAKAVAGALDAGHAHLSCAPGAHAISARAMKLRVLRMEIVDGHADSVNLALIEPQSGLLWLLSVNLFATGAQE